MRVLGITETCDLGSMYLRLLGEGHQVKVTISEQLARGTMAGLVPHTRDWRAELDWLRTDEDGVILFEAVGFGELQDELRADGFKVIGGSAFGDRLESDRNFAFDLLAQHGMNTAPVREFTSSEEAIADLDRYPRRCVFKLSASEGGTFVGTFEDGSDVAALIDAQPPPEGTSFILMDHLDGIETGVGAYFNGRRFLQPACLDWEHKRFFAGDMGELTGEMGTVATFRGSERLFETALKPLEPLLRDAGHVGWVNLNTIINEQDIWPLEFTCRFGYPGFAVLEPLQALNWSELFRLLCDDTTETFPTYDGFSACVVLTTPPMPLSRKHVNAPVGLPVKVDDIEARHLHLGEVGAGPRGLVTAGLYGWTAVVTGTGHSVTLATAAAYANAQKVHAPNMRYRLDVGEKLINGDFQRLIDWDWIAPSF